jgi:hypothetical protein
MCPSGRHYTRSRARLAPRRHQQMARSLGNRVRPRGKYKKPRGPRKIVPLEREDASVGSLGYIRAAPKQIPLFLTMPFKKLSGSAYRKRNKIRDKSNKTCAKFLAEFLHTETEIQASTPSTSRDSTENVENLLDTPTISSNSSAKNIFTQKDEQQSDEQQTSPVKEIDMKLDSKEGNDNGNDEIMKFDYKNLESWPSFISNSIRDHIVSMKFSTEVDKEYKYPLNSEKRHFSADLFYRNMHCYVRGCRSTPWRKFCDCWITFGRCHQPSL